jgi:amino acid transporter
MSAEREFGYTQELKRALTVWDLVIYGMIFMVPIAPFGVFGYVYHDARGMVPLAYLVGMVAMFFTAMSYWAMSRAFPVAGSVYAYAQRGIHETVGFFSGWLILLDYILVPALLYLVSAEALRPILPHVPDWLWLAGFIGINTLINFFGVEFTARANRYILVAEGIILAVFIVLGLIALYSGDHPTGLTLKPLYDADKFSVSVVVGAVSIAVLSFLGFDGISTLSEESRDGVDSVGKASLWALLVVGSLFILQTWVAVDLARGTTFSSTDGAFYDTAAIAGGPALRYATIWATALSWGIANALVAQAAISRILFAMGRDRKLPHVLSKVHPKYQTPYVSTILVAIVSLAVGLAFIGQIDELSSIVNFGALTGFFVLHLSVINHFMIRQRSKRWILHLVFPLIGLFIIGYVLFLMDWRAKAIGLAWLAAGIVYYLVNTRLFRREISMEL